MDTPTPFVFDLFPDIDPCRNATGLDLDVTIGPPLGVPAWPDDGDVVVGADPIGTSKSYRPDGSLVGWTDEDLVATP